MRPKIQEVFDANFRVYGARKVWRQLKRQGEEVARCTVERLMRGMGLAGASRGKAVKTTVPDKATLCPLDRVNRQFGADRPNAPSGIGLHVRVHLDRLRLRCLRDRRVHAAHRRLAGQSDGTRRLRPGRLGVGPASAPPLPGRTDPPQRQRRAVCLVKYTERLALAGIEPSVGSGGDSYANALAETINGLYKTEVIHRRGPWKSFEAVEIATLEWVDWFNNQRLLEPIGNIPPAEANYYAALAQSAMAA